MTLEQILEDIESKIDGAAAIGSSTDASTLANLLANLAEAARLRAEAIPLRLTGRIDLASGLESKSEAALEFARKFT